MRAILVMAAVALSAVSAHAQSLAPTPAPAPATACEPRAAAQGSPAISTAFEPSWLVGVWRLTVWVNGRGVPDTIISGNLMLFPRQLDSANLAYGRVTPVIGHTDLELDYVRGIEPFKTPASSRSTVTPGVEFRTDADGPRLVFGNPTLIKSSPVVSLGVVSNATFYLFSAFTHEFRGQWSHARGGADRAWGGFCAVRITDG
jgi:hypothetical protein